MLTTKKLFTIVQLFLAFCLLLNAQNLKAQDKYEAFWQIAKTAEDILQGKNVGQTTKAIAKNAELIYGAKVAKLRSVVVDNKPPFYLADTTFHGVSVEAKTNNSEDMGLIRFKTVRRDTTIVRYHTIVVEKDSTGQFSIIAWHTSGAE